MWRALAIVAALFLGGCNTWTRYYIDALGKPVEQVPELEPYYGNPVVVCTEDVGVGIQRLRTAAFEPIGFSVFNDEEVIDVGGAVVHATQIAAAVVLVYTRYPHAFCGGMTSPEGRRVETNIATAPVVSLDVLAPVGSGTLSDRQTFGEYSEKYSDYDYVAVYLARRRTLHGAVLSDLGDDDVYDLGARVDALLPGSPFDRAGVQLGDIVVIVDDVEMLDTWHVTKSVNEAVGPTVKLQVLRDGGRIDLTLTVPKEPENRRR